MPDFVEYISVCYGDAEVSFFNIVLEPELDYTAFEHRHSYFEVHIALDPYKLYLGDTKVNVKEGEIIILPPATKHRIIVADGNKKPTVVSFALRKINGDKGFYELFTKQLMKNALKPIPAVGIKTAETVLLNNTEYYKTVLGILKLKSVAAEFFEALFCELDMDKNILVNGSRDVEVLIDVLANAPDMTVQKIAAATNYSPRQISRIIKQRYGTTLTEFKKAKSAEFDDREDKK